MALAEDDKVIETLVLDVSYKALRVFVANPVLGRLHHDYRSVMPAFVGG